MLGHRKKLCFCVCILPVSLLCAYLICAYTIVYEHGTSQTSHLSFANDFSYANLRQENPPSSSRYVLKNRGFHSKSGQRKPPEVFSVLSGEGEYLGGFRTDVDRTEDRKKKKSIAKLKKSLTDLCQKSEDKIACQDLQILEEKIAQNGNNLDPNLFFYSPILPNVSEARKDWNSYADRGLTIVGKKESLQRRLPHVLIIGAKKAGTRALLEFLRIHPSVTAAGAELHFFDRFFYRGPAWYRSKLPESLEGQLTIEKTPAYFVDKDVPARVKEFIPTIKLLLIVRDPVNRAVSDYTQSLSKHELRKNFRNLVLKNASSGLVNVAWGPIRGGLYARHYQRWRKFFPSSSIHVVSGEGLISNPAKEMSDVQEFLGIEKVINDRHFYFNATKGFPCLVKREKNGRPHCLGYSKGRTHPKVDQDVLDILRDFYRPFNAKFYKLVGRHFGWA